MWRRSDATHRRVREFATMAHELFPRDGNTPLPLDEVIRRLRDSFRHVDLNQDRASQELTDSVRYMARTGSPHFTGEDIERARRAIGRATYVIIADEPDAPLAYLSFLLEPDHDKIFLDYESSAHEEMSRDLRGRLARVLDYEVELV
jgi:hypothetical protein